MKEVTLESRVHRVRSGNQERQGELDHRADRVTGEPRESLERKVKLDPLE